MARRAGPAPKYVFDVSVWLKLFIAEPDSDVAAALIESESNYLAPDVLFAEFCNVIWLKRRVGDLSAKQAHEAIDQLAGFFGAFDIVWSAELMSTALDLAITIDHPVYDCLYLVLADESGLVLITADRKFYRAVRKVRPGTKIQLLGP
jgi:predicted nucleic acid-binding protein